MGGQGSGGSNRLSDEERKARGTYRADQSDELYDQRAAAKILQGPWLSAIPEPDFPLTPIGRKKFDEITQALFEQGKLTQIAVGKATSAGVLWQKIATAIGKGRSPATADLKFYDKIVDELQIARDAKVIASPKRSRFADAGFSNSRTSPIRLLTAADLSKERQNR